MSEEVKTEEVQGETWDMRERFRAEIKPLIEKINKLCDEMGIPFVAAFMTANSNNESECVEGKINLPGGDRNSPTILAMHLVAQSDSLPSAVIRAAQISGKLSELMEASGDKH